jgi:fumarate hydratase class II
MWDQTKIQCFYGKDGQYEQNRRLESDSLGEVRAFTESCVRGVEANRMKAEHWLMKNAAVITVLNPLIGYAASAALAKEALGEDESIRQVEIRKAAAGELRHRDEERLVT